ncbi:MAG: ATP-binding protein [Terracidiphilus sp.]|jgi:signal transduction histidine kinase
MKEILEDDETKWIGLRETLRQSQSLAVAGQFAATVMHEINNPLEAISNLNYLLQGDAHNPELVVRYSQQIDEQLAVLTRIARQSLSFYRPAAEKSPVAAAALAEAALRIHRKSIAAKRIHIDIRLANDVTMDVHPGEMLQVISNLISNAVDALPIEGSLYLRGRRSCRGVSLLVADAGPGIPDSIVQRIFDPFFTTKQDKGTGLGLAISKAIVEKHKGLIRTRSSTRAGRTGTAFRISLPLPPQVAIS